MNGVLGHYSALQGYTHSGTTLANEIKFGMNHVPDAGSINNQLTCIDCATIVL